MLLVAPFLRKQGHAYPILHSRIFLEPLQSDDRFQQVRYICGQLLEVRHVHVHSVVTMGYLQVLLAVPSSCSIHHIFVPGWQVYPSNPFRVLPILPHPSNSGLYLIII